MTRFAAALAALFLYAGSASAQPQALPAEQLRKIKSSTVFIKVSHGPQLRGTGSGFVVHATKDYGLIVTNEHVVSPPPDIPIQGKTGVEVVFSSGQSTGEWTVPAEILYANKEDDLALLKVKALKPIPAPLPLEGADALPETTPVYVCGFPFGQDLAEEDKNPEISIGVASVSSNRTDANGKVVTVQLNGALNPGNSGGPVVTQDGKLVGVAVRTLRGAGIGFAVPPDKVRRAVQDVHFAPPVVSKLDGKFRLVSKYVDAFGNLKALTAHVIPAPNAWNTPNATDISKDPQATRHAPTVNAAQSTATLDLAMADGAHVWLQFAWTDGTGSTRRSVPVRVGSAPTPEPLPVAPDNPANPADRFRNFNPQGNGPLRLDAPRLDGANAGGEEKSGNRGTIAGIAVVVGLLVIGGIGWLVMRMTANSGRGKRSRKPASRRDRYGDDDDEDDDDRPRSRSRRRN